MFSNMIFHCPVKENAKALMQMLSVHGIKWSSEESLTEQTHWDRYKEETCYILIGNNLMYGSLSLATSYYRFLPIIKFNKLNSIHILLQEKGIYYEVP